MNHTNPSRSPVSSAAIVAGLAVLSGLSPFAASFAAASPPAFGADDVPTAFAIRKSSNRNRVDYGVRVDGDCAPKGSDPVLPYWRMLERGADVLEPLRRFERRAYGIGSQRVARDAEGGSVRMRLRAVGDRDVTVRTSRRENHCDAAAVTTIGGTEATLDDIYVVLSGSVSVDHVELRGRAVGSGASVTESLRR